MVFVDMDGNPIDLDPNETIWIPEKVPVRFVIQGGPGGGGGGITTFEQLRKKELDDPIRGKVADVLMRNTLRLSFWNHIHKIGAFGALLAKNVVFLQLVLIDENRDIQGKLYQGLHRQNPEDPDVADHSRYVFKALIPHLLQDTERWVISRSLVIKEYNRGLLDETLLKLLPYDLVGGLTDIPFDLPFGTPDKEVSKQNNSLMAKALKEYKDTPVPLGIHCTEIVPAMSIVYARGQDKPCLSILAISGQVFMFIAGDFALDNDRDLNSRDAVLKLLRYLDTEEGIQKLYGFDEMSSGCPEVSPEKISVLRGMHLTA